MYLANASPVFKIMFTSEFKEKTLQSIELPGKKHTENLELLKMIYPIFTQEFDGKFMFTYLT